MSRTRPWPQDKKIGGSLHEAFFIDWGLIQINDPAVGGIGWIKLEIDATSQHCVWTDTAKVSAAQDLFIGFYIYRAYFGGD